MEFGKLADISGVDWNLPPDDPNNPTRLAPTETSSLYFGAPTWGSKLWRNKIYPPDGRPEEFLFHYSRYFDCIELNTTHYRIPDARSIQNWRSSVPASFIFCPKVYKEISHARVGLMDKKMLAAWLGFIEGMGENLGPCFIQLHEQFSYSDKHLLFNFLQSWPSEFKLSLELRHPSWFEDHKILPALVEYLNRRNIGLVITDVAGRRDVLHTSISAPWVLIRLIGNNLVASDELRLTEWAQRLKSWQRDGVQETYLFLHQPDDVWTIEFSQLARRVFERTGYEKLPNFELLKSSDQISLEL